MSDHSWIINNRLRVQRLQEDQFTTPEAVVDHFVAVQAQDFLPALWALGLRTRDATESFVEKAIFERAIVRTWPIRNTVHFITPADIRWVLELSAPKGLRDNARLRELELDGEIFSRSRKVLTDSLGDGRPQTRPALYAALEQAGISTAGQRGYHILCRLSQEGLICIGPREGKQHTIVLLDAWVPPGKSLSREEALAELALRYFASHGPATIKDYTWWSGLAAAEARAGLEMAKPRLEQTKVGDDTYWFSAPSVDSGKSPSSTHLLPFLDEYLVAYKDRSAPVPPEYNALVDSGNVIFHQPVIVHGRVAGIWTRQLKRDSIVVTVSLFRTLSASEMEALVAAVDRLGVFLGLTAQLSLVTT